MEGGDSGWRIGYQFIAGPIARGPWNEEKLWHPHFDGQAAYIVPPIANLADGPSGLTYDPGVSLLPDAYRRHFFLVDFRGASGQSGIRSFAMKSRGASFELVDSKPFLWHTLATDVDFGPDGALYFSDWVEGWGKPNKGRIYRVLDPKKVGDPKVAEVRRLLASPMLLVESIDDHIRRLGHPDMRVRQASQYALVERAREMMYRMGGGVGMTAPDLTRLLARTAATPGDLLRRVHAIWTMGQIERVNTRNWKLNLPDNLIPLLADREPEVRAQAAKELGEAREAKAFGALVARLKDESPRVRSLAAIAVGKLGRAEAVAPLLAMLRSDGDDPYLRHAAVMGLVGSSSRDPAALRQAVGDASPSARMGVLLAMRRLGDPEIARFVKDADPRLVLEAARAIHDVPVDAALAALADLPMAKDAPMPLLRRILDARQRRGEVADAAALAETAARADLPAAARALALQMLGHWAKPPGRDAVVGLWRPISPRHAEPAAEALKSRFTSIAADKGTPESVRDAAIEAVGTLKIKEAGATLVRLATDRDQPDRTRSTALKALETLGDPRRVDAARRAAALPGSSSRAEALRILAEADPAAATPLVLERIERGSTSDRQGALAALAAMPGEAPRKAILRLLDQLQSGKVAPELHLDLLEAAARRTEPEVRDRLRAYNESRPKADPLAAYRELLAGGNARRGREVFTSKAATECLRCHKAQTRYGDIPGGEVGPDLAGIAAKHDRAYLLESIVDPNKQIAQGFESVILALDDGRVVTGVLRGEDDRVVHLMTAEGKAVDVPKSTIDGRKRGPSAMPTDLAPKLSRTELRDLVEFLASLKTPRKP